MVDREGGYKKSFSLWECLVLSDLFPGDPAFQNTGNYSCCERVVFRFFGTCHLFSYIDSSTYSGSETFLFVGKTEKGSFLFLGDSFCKELQVSLGISWKNYQKIKECLLSAWIDSLVKVGLCESSGKSLRNARLHSLRLELVTNAEKYISKLGNEIGEPNVKSGRGSKRYMPFDILASAESGEDWGKAAWIEYYLVTKGKRQLVWSDGLKARFKVQEYSDQELADWRAERDFENLFGFEDWEAIRKLPEVEACLEHVISCGAYQKLRDFFQKIGITLITDKSILDSEVEKPLKEQY